MHLHLLRHAEAEERSLTGRDADRWLTAAGEKRMKRIGRAIAALEPGYEAILVSPLVRARQTAKPVAAALGFTRDFVETRALVPSADPEEVLHEVARLGAASVLLVGHEPHMGRLFARLLVGRSDPPFPMKKAALAAFECAGDPAVEASELRFFLPPRLLEKLG